MQKETDKFNFDYLVLEYQHAQWSIPALHSLSVERRYQTLSVDSDKYNRHSTKFLSIFIGTLIICFTLP